jgi:hypothetical protein
MEHRFGDTLWFPQLASDLGLRLVRIVGIGFPALSLVKTHQLSAAVISALVLGIDGVARAHSARTVKYVSATEEGLSFCRHSRSHVVRWPDVSSVRGWRRFARTSHIAIEVQRNSRAEILRCWDYSSPTKLAEFLSTCASFMGSKNSPPMVRMRFASASSAVRLGAQAIVGMALCYWAGGPSAALVGAVYPLVSTTLGFGQIGRRSSRRSSRTSALRPIRHHTR